jgi:hypothetical protein
MRDGDLIRALNALGQEALVVPMYLPAGGENGNGKASGKR